MRRLLASLALCTLPLAAAAPATAAEFIFTADLAPEAVGATGSGTVKVTFDTTAHTLAIATLWSGLTGATTVSHIHCCVAPPGTAGVAVTPGTLPGFPVGVTGGSYAVTLDLTDGDAFGHDWLGEELGEVEAARLPVFDRRLLIEHLDLADHLVE